MDAKTDWEALAQAVQDDRRQGKRVPLAFPIEVRGLDGAGRPFVERTITSDISAAGCRFKLRKKVSPGEVVAIRLLTRLSASTDPGRPMLFEIAWIEENAGAWVSGAKKLEAKDIWPVEFPGKPATRPKA
jgi:hypothetical protein